MNWIDWLIGGGIIIITAAIVIRGILKRRRGASACSGCPYANECVRGGTCPRKTEAGKEDRP